jgi:protein-disulfide isomerase
VGQTETLKIKDLAEGVGMTSEDLAQNLNSPKAHHLLLTDIREGMRANMTGTPAYRIDGEVYLGQIPPGILEAVIQ